MLIFAYMFNFLLKYTLKPFRPALFIAIIFAGALTSCNGRLEDNRSPEDRRVMILYSAGFNSLSQYLKSDIEELKQGFIPGNAPGDNVLLVFSKLPVKDRDYETQTAPVLFRLYKNSQGKVIADTLFIKRKGTIAASATTLKSVLEYIKKNFSAASYGLIVSSHATGWLPKGYYNNPVESGSSWNGKRPNSFFPSYEGQRLYNDIPVPYIELDQDPSIPQVKSITQETSIENGLRLSYEAEMEDFASAIPMYLDYIIFDACLMGCIEVAHSLKNKCSLIGFSPTEILADGFDYKKLAGRLIGGLEPDVKGACQDYFQQYDNKEGSYRSATISLINCSKLDGLASVCNSLFAKYKAEIASIDPSTIQRYYRQNRHWFYDLEDIVVKSGASQEDISKLKTSLGEAVIYKAATPAFLGIDINTYSGFSMYLPAHGSAYLNNFYKSLSWNKATALVE